MASPSCRAASIVGAFTLAFAVAGCSSGAAEPVHEQEPVTIGTEPEPIAELGDDRVPPPVDEADEPAPVPPEPTQRSDGLRVIDGCGAGCELELATGFLLDELGVDPAQLTVATSGDFAVWWDARFDSRAQAADLVEVAEAVQDELSAFGVGRPGASDAGYFTNVFLHRGDDDVFPGFFGNGVGYEGDDEGGGPVFASLSYPFEEDLVDNRVNLLHELLHIFQGATYDGWEDEVAGESAEGEAGVEDDDHPDAAWFIEALAEWYQMSRVGDTELRAFENVAAITATPEYPLWSFFPREELPDGVTEEQQEALDYATGIRQYSNGAFLYFLTEVEGIDQQALFDAMFLDRYATPQEELAMSLGVDELRRSYVRWATESLTGFSYLPEVAVEFSTATFEELASPAPDGFLRPFAIDIDGAAPDGEYTPSPTHWPGAWDASVARVTDPVPGTYDVGLDAAPTGVDGTPAHFEATIVVEGEDGGSRTVDVSMVDEVTGTATVVIETSDAALNVVSASVPELFEGDETFEYSLSISTGE